MKRLAVSRFARLFLKIYIYLLIDECWRSRRHRQLTAFRRCVREAVVVFGNAGRQLVVTNISAAVKEFTRRLESAKTS